MKEKQKQYILEESTKKYNTEKEKYKHGVAKKNNKNLGKDNIQNNVTEKNNKKLQKDKIQNNVTEKNNKNLGKDNIQNNVTEKNNQKLQKDKIQNNVTEKNKQMEHTKKDGINKSGMKKLEKNNKNLGKDNIQNKRDGEEHPEAPEGQDPGQRDGEVEQPQGAHQGWDQQIWAEEGGEEQQEGWHGEQGDGDRWETPGWHGKGEGEKWGDDGWYGKGEGEKWGDDGWYGKGEGEGWSDDGWYGKGGGEGWDENELEEQGDNPPEDVEEVVSSETKTDEKSKDEPEETDLPKDVDSLPSFFYGKGLMQRDDMWNYFTYCVDSDHYLAVIMEQIKAHKMLKPFEGFINQTYEMVGWDIHRDQEHEEFTHTISDFVHYLMMQPMTSPLTLDQIFALKHPENMEEQKNNEDEEAQESWEEAQESWEDENGMEEDTAEQSRDEQHDLGVKEKEKRKEYHEMKAGVKKAKTDLEEKDDEKTKPGSSKDKVPVRHRKKGPAKVGEGDEAWTVTWGPVTKKGVVDFVSNCSGQPVSTWEPNTFKPDTINTSGKSIGNTNHSIRWQLIKPGETSYVLGRFFCQFERKNMTRSQGCSPQKTCYPHYLCKQDRFVLLEIWKTFYSKRM